MREDIIRNCWKCPYYEALKDICELTKKEPSPTIINDFKTYIPEWCPLRKMPILIKLSETDETRTA